MSATAQFRVALADRYEIEREIGRGGMATVYLARDVRHERLVALKVLDPELGAVLGVERFLAEIRVTANLQHPNLLPLFDSGDAGGLLFYVMPYVAGESLRVRLERERQLPVDEAVGIAVAIASALDYAHRHGVIHRDLKPENILLHEGQPLVADFGIALAVSRAGGNRITQTGLSLGTPQYMSPEQATGDRVIDGRTDIYSLAAMLFEMLTGDPPHVGSTAQAVIAKLLIEKPQRVRALREAVSEPVDIAVERGLAKLPADRYATAHEFADALRAPAARETARAAGSSQHERRRTVARVAALWPWVATLLACVALGLWGTRRGRDAPAGPVRFFIDLPHDDPLVQGIAISPDASLIVYAITGGLMARPLDELNGHLIPGTAGATAPFFSPDGEWIGYLAEAKLKKVRVSGGVPVLISDSLTTIGGAAWSPDGEIVFTNARNGLGLVPASGGRPRLLTTPRQGERHLWPAFLPDGNGILFTIWRGALQTSELAVTTLDGTETRLGLRGFNSHYMDGRLVFVREDGSLAIVPFDPKRLRIGSGERLTGEVVQVFNPGATNYAVGANGSLVYARGAQPNQPVIIDRAGILHPLALELRTYARPRYSPDGRRVLFDTRSGAYGEIWLYDIASATLQRLTAGDDVHQPEWRPDGRQIAFTARSDSTAEDIMVMPLDGSSRPTPMLTAAGDQYDATWTPDGRSLIYIDDDPFQRFGILHTGDGTTSKWIGSGEFGGTLLGPRASPNGRQIAYWSNESGREEVYVRSFPETGGVLQVSSGGGTEPVWSRDGRELFYRQDDKLIAASITTTPTLAVTARHLLFAQQFLSDGGHTFYDVSPDGKSFIFLKSGEGDEQLVVVLNWAEALRRSDPKD